MSDRTSIELDAQEAYEAIRSINHATIFTGDGIPGSSDIWWGHGVRPPAARSMRRR